MPEVYLVRRWGAHDANQTVDVPTDIEAKWLVDTNHAEWPDARGTASAGARAPGTDGADIRAGGDPSRGGGMKNVRGGRHDGEMLESGEQNYQNRAAPVAGSPKARNTVGTIADAPPESAGKASDESKQGDQPKQAEQDDK
jgi:hypothetical protein